MRRILIPATPGLSDWQAGLADPELHWKRGRSAFELAVTWEVTSKTERGLPVQVAALFDQKSGTSGATLLLAVPEHKVALQGRGPDSQSDVWALLKNVNGLISLTVESKAGEPFDKTVEKWSGGTVNQLHRLHGLCQTLQLSPNDVVDLRYQLLHRAASAVLEANRFGASQAVLLVQYFGEAAVGFDDFKTFAERLGATGVMQGQLVSARPINGLPFYLGWLDCPFVTDSEVAEVTLVKTQAKVAEGFAASLTTAEELDDSVFDLPVGQVRP